MLLVKEPDFIVESIELLALVRPHLPGWDFSSIIARLVNNLKFNQSHKLEGVIYAELNEHAKQPQLLKLMVVAAA